MIGNSNKIHFKQILIDSYNYKALKVLGKTGDSFNDVISSLIKSNNKYRQEISNSLDKITFSPNNKSFRLRIDSTLRKLGVISIECHRDHMTINFRGEVACNIDYPENIEDLQDSIESGLRLKTELFESNIQTIGSYISENIGQIRVALEQIRDEEI